MSSLGEVALAPIEKVENHPNADRLDIATVWGCPAIVGRDQFKEGDTVVYIPPDFIIPATPDFAENLHGMRIKGIKLRKVFSMCLLLENKWGFVEGDDIAERLGIVKYERFSQAKGVSRPGVSMGKSQEAPAPSGVVSSKYDLESLRRYHSMLIQGEEVVCTEKVHGCLFEGSKIRMANGSNLKLKDIVKNNMVGEYVLGVDEYGKLIPSKITNVFDNGKTNEWLNIKGTRNGMNKGNSYFSITCTKNHKFFVNNEYIEASNLKIDDEVTSFRGDFTITPLQNQVLIGKMLGDGSLRVIKHTANVAYSHAQKYEEYLDWTSRALGTLSSNTKGYAISGHGSPMVRARTVNNHHIKEKFSSFIENGKKIVPEWIINEITPISLAFWYMDDGSLRHHKDQEDRAVFHTNCFTNEDCSVLQRCLEKFNIQTKIAMYDSHQYNNLELNADNSEKLFILIAPYIPTVMQYKLPERYRGHNGWLPGDINQEFKQKLVKQKITSITKIEKNQTKYDLETETHNFFVSDTLVHNSNARYYHDGEKLHAGSRTRWLVENDSCVWWKVAHKYKLSEKLAKTPGLMIYGEVLGVQDLNYGFTDGAGFMAFDIFDPEIQKFLDYDLLMEYLRSLDIPPVPELYRGPWNGYDNHSNLAEGKSTIADHVREGFVIKPIKERYTHFGRIVFKLPGQDYLMRP